MRVHFDPEADALYVRLADSAVVESEEVRPGVVLDFDENHQVVGVELLGVGRRVPLADLRRMEFEVA